MKVPQTLFQEPKQKNSRSKQIHKQNHFKLIWLKCCMLLGNYQYSEDHSKLRPSVTLAKWHESYTWTLIRENLNSFQSPMSSGLALILPPQLQEAFILDKKLGFFTLYRKFSLSFSYKSFLFQPRTLSEQMNVSEEKVYFKNSLPHKINILLIAPRNRFYSILL